MTAQLNIGKILLDESNGNWGIDAEIKKFGEQFGELIAVFVTLGNVRDGKITERWCFADKNLSQYDGGKGYQAVRYVTLSSLAGGIAPVCAISREKGKVKFLKNLHGESTSFDRPLQVKYMRVTNV